MNVKDFICQMPKAELHIHIEGSLEPELMFELAQRNKVSLPYSNVAEVRSAYNFHNLQSFLDIYYAGAEVLLTERDFFDLTWAYFQRCHRQNVIHTEIFFDPQTHTSRGVSFDIMMSGMIAAQQKAEVEFGISSYLIMCFLRHLSQESAMQTLDEALAYKDNIIGVGLDSSELGNPPEKFANVFNKAIANGFYTVAHAGEEGPPQYIWDALHQLQVKRIDHGVRCVEDPELVSKLAADKIPLTVCPLSNTKLKVFTRMEEHNILVLLEQGVHVTVNSDDPAYFGGYLNENFLALASDLNLSRAQAIQLANNSFHASFLPEEEKRRCFNKLDVFCQENR